MRIHLIGIGGVGMAGLAVLLKARGHEVSGCDLHPSPRTHWLAERGIPVRLGHSPSHLDGIDQVIVTPAVDRGNPELAACGGAVPVRFRGDVLAELVSASEGIAVCGSHGKTTTSTWIAKLLLALGEDVSWCIGGETGAFPVAGASSALGSALVVEADESDGTLARYHAKTLVVNKCEYDHPDHFKSEADYFACYEAAKRNADEVIESESLGLALFDSERFGFLRDLPLHNLRNVRAATEVALRRGHALDDIARHLPSIVAELPDRRFQRIWPQSSEDDRDDFRVYADYAHHPTEMKCAIQMARRICSGKLSVLFQPHRYSRTRALLNDFPAAFEGADEVVLCPTYAAFEHPVEGGDVTDLYRACRAAESPASVRRLDLCPSCEAAWERVSASRARGDVVLLLGAGDIIRLVPRVLADLSAASERSRADEN